MPEMPLRQAATLLLEYAIRIAPPESREWGQAMRGELSFVEGHWGALGWAFGGASVMVKHALIAFFLPGRGRQLITPYVDLFERRVPIRRAVMVTAVGFVLAAFVFLAAPPFRQALRVSLEGWNLISESNELRALAKDAEAHRDPEGLVFVAARLRDGKESARLAEEAAQLDPNLAWIYSVVAARHEKLANIRDWLPKLERWDPQNGAIHLITARSLERGFDNLPQKKPQTYEEMEVARRSEFAAMFASPKFDDYLDRLRELDRRVVRRYRFSDPRAVIWWEDNALPLSEVDIPDYAGSVVKTGEALQARGDINGAAQRYWIVARFGQVLDSQGHTGYERYLGWNGQAAAYEGLQKLAEKQGNANEAALFAYLVERFARSAKEKPLGADERRGFGEYVSWRNAIVLQLSGLLTVVFAGLMVAAALILRLGGHEADRGVCKRSKPVATVVAFASGVGVLVSAATIYLTYRPYWYIFQRVILNGDRSHTLDLIDFLADVHVQSLIATREGELLWSFLLSGSPRSHVFIWTGVIYVGITCLLIILLREIRGRLSAGKLQNHTQMP